MSVFFDNQHTKDTSDWMLTKSGSFAISLDVSPWLSGGETQAAGFSSSAKTLTPSTPKSTTGHDATARDGLRYEVKARRITGAVGSRQLSAIRKLDEQHFDVLVGVLFDEDYGVHRACAIPHGVVLECASFQKHTNAWVLHLRDEIWTLPGVVDVTEKLRHAQG